MSTINKVEYDEGGDDNDSVWGGDSTWGGGEQDDFSVSVYNAKTQVTSKNSRPKAVPISRIQIGGPPPSSTDKSAPTTSMRSWKQLPPSGKSKQSGPASFHASTGNLGVSFTAFPSKQSMAGESGFQVVPATLSPKGSKEIHGREKSQTAFGDFGYTPGVGNQEMNPGALRVKSKAASETGNFGISADDSCVGQTRLFKSYSDLPSFDNPKNSSTPVKPTRRSSAREDNSDTASANSINESSLSLEGFPRAAIPMDGIGSRAGEGSRERKSDTSARSGRSSDKPLRSQRSLFNSFNSDGEKERTSRGGRLSDRSQPRDISIDSSQEKRTERSPRASRSKSPSRSGKQPTSPVIQRRAPRGDRSKSPGKFKDRPDRTEKKDRTTVATDTKERSGRSQSPGKFRNKSRNGRSKSPGTLSRRQARRDRSSSPGRFSNTTSRRRAVEDRAAPRRTKSDDLGKSFSESRDKDGGNESKKEESVEEAKRRRGVARTKSMDVMPRSDGPVSAKTPESEDSGADQPASRRDLDCKPARRTRPDRTKELVSALKFVDNQAGSARRSRRRGDDRSYKSEGSSDRREAESRRIRRSTDSKKPSSTKKLTLMDEIEAQGRGKPTETVRLVKEKRKQEEARLKRLKEEARLLEEKRLCEEMRIHALKEEARILEEKRKDEEARMKAAVELAKEQREAEASSLREQLELVREQRLAEEARISRLREEMRLDQEKNLAVDGAVAQADHISEESRTREPSQSKSASVGIPSVLKDESRIGSDSGDKGCPYIVTQLKERSSVESQLSSTALAAEENPRKLRPWELMEARKATIAPKRSESLEIPVSDPPAFARKPSLESRSKKFGGNSGNDAQLPPAFRMLNKAKK